MSDGSEHNESLAVDSAEVPNPALGDDGHFYGSSVQTGVFDYVYANGRRYNAYRAGNWVVPNDQSEQDRMDLMHHHWKAILGGKSLKFGDRVEPMDRVLDIGTGTGLWAIDVADEFPEATVIGTDLSPIQPSWTPPNCHFFVDDAESMPWEFEHPFDVIHFRSMEAAFKDWPAIYRQTLESLRPGGIVENHSLETWIFSLDADVPPGIMEWQRSLIEAARRFGREMDISSQHGRLMREAGFTEIEEITFKVPLGPWAKGDKALSEIALAVALYAIESYSLALFTDVLGLTEQRTREMIERAQTEVMDLSKHLYVMERIIFGRKPFAVP